MRREDRPLNRLSTLADPFWLLFSKSKYKQPMSRFIHGTGIFLSQLSLSRSYHRYKSKVINHLFFLIPSIDVHIDYDPSDFTRSPRGLPYPKLEVFIQSCLDTYNLLQLCDVIDGTNVSEEWREKHLGLEGTNDVEWAREKNKRGLEFGGKWAHAAFAREGRRSKQDVAGVESPDPWMELSDMS
ncbi:uncharacterized protein PADG_05349 [Paracoccidioides brasiliensis Pb18]|uniref:Uncharacterized protein n=1 Tax=Paracoccidioides brasiliensis (strain Pb18) TaxID=502780 RepID=C1GDL3_PARBD|nr:uncharacterized protein PADG_05349 [Paracoccidioides brasiliensis Pb18]EEH49270.2 hypothetical protein PADG_05349 [Paracoccidioides brasiliensis Pb18]